MAVNREFADRWAYDISQNVISKGEIWDVDVLNQSIELILGTVYGERLFNTSFGCGLQLRIFESMTPEAGEDILNEIARQLKLWEDRIIVLEDEMRLNFNGDSNSITITIPYIIRDRNLRSVFKKKIIT